MSTSLAHAAAKALGEHIVAELPELAGRVRVGQADVDDVAQGAYPLLAILPGRLSFTPLTEEEIADVGTDKQLVEVGDWDGRVELRVYAQHAPQRERLEQALLDVLLAREGAPGVLVVDMPRLVVAGVATLQDVVASFTLEGDAWREEMVFAKKRYAFLDLEVGIPALVLRTGVYTTDQLVLALTEDMTTTLAEAIPVEEVDVADDGTISP